MKFEITTEKRGAIESIQRDFADKLSTNEILRATAQGINSALSRSVPRINKQVKAEYNITQKYLSRMAMVSPKANSGSLWGGIKINESRLPIYAFRPKQTGGSITVAIHKGKPTVIRNAFIATMANGHTGVYSRGKYTKKTGFAPGREKTSSGKVRITELQTGSVFTMAINQSVSADVQQFMGDEAVARVHGILRARVDKLAAQYQ